MNVRCIVAGVYYATLATGYALAAGVFAALLTNGWALLNSLWPAFVIGWLGAAPIIAWMESHR